MIDEMLGHIFGRLIFGRLENSQRVQLLIRLFFGLLMAGLGVAGALHFSSRYEISLPMRMCAVGMFVFLSAFGLFNITLARKWKWPAILFVISFVAMFVVRIAVGP
jgi:hypothetical protein